MSDNRDLDYFRNNDGSTSLSGQQNAGKWESDNYNSSSHRQTWESHDDYNTRQNAFDYNRNNK